MFLNPPRWTVVFVDENFVVIEDLKMVTDLTITNGIEQVTRQINAEYDLTKRHLIYGDSTGLYDAVDVNDEGNFYNFLYLGMASHIEAIQVFKEKYQHLLKGK
ncbi:hypothetical protein [Acinetobacter lwoffii]|uniref:hypothetical protein n=1 Tax=Acinetobacter lwoffii TaxID=28090 RepID=UPI003BF7501A